MEASYLLHVPAVLPQGKQPLCSVLYEAAWQGADWRENFFLPPVIKPQLLVANHFTDWNITTRSASRILNKINTKHIQEILINTNKKQLLSRVARDGEISSPWIEDRYAL
jgi:hypothetical protein